MANRQSIVSNTINRACRELSSHRLTSFVRVNSLCSRGVDTHSSSYKACAHSDLAGLPSIASKLKDRPLCLGDRPRPRDVNMSCQKVKGCSTGRACRKLSRHHLVRFVGVLYDEQIEISVSDRGAMIHHIKRYNGAQRVEHAESFPSVVSRGS